VSFASEIFEDHAFGKHYERGTERKVSNQVAQEIAAAMTKYLTG
jgi:hypothetical protein